MNRGSTGSSSFSVPSPSPSPRASEPAAAAAAGSEWVHGLALAGAVACAVLVLAAIGLVFLVAPVEARMGIIQKIFYFHVPSAIATYGGFVVCGVGSLGYLLSRKPRWDALGVAGAEVGLFFCALVLVTGPMWARGAWGTWWIWEPQLTTTLVLFFIYMAYMVVRSMAASVEGGRKVAALLGFIGILDIYVIHTAVKRWGGHHPQVIRRGGGGLEPLMWLAFAVSVVAFLAILATLVSLRYRIEVGRRRLEAAEIAGLTSRRTES